MFKRYYPIPRNAIKVPLPDTKQKRDYSCGPAAVMAVCRYFGVGFDYEKDFIRLFKKLGMKLSVGSHPYHIEKVLTSDMQCSGIFGCMEGMGGVVV